MQLTRDELLDAYQRMCRIREFEERVSIEFFNGNIPGFVHLYSGQEASAVGICLNLGDSDYIGSTHRGHGHCIAKGCDIKGMMAELFGKKDGLCKGKGGSMHIADLSKGMLGANAIVGGSPPLVIGAALTAKVKKSGAIAAAFIGDGASNQGTVFEAMNMAVVLQLPAIFVIENNGYGEFTGVEYAVPVKDIAARAAGFGMPGVAVNGFDFFAVHGAMREAAERARAGGGPSVIETRSSRYHGHFVGDPQMYRGKDEVDNFRRDHDALVLFRKRVTEAALLESEELDRIHQGVLQEVEDAVTAARNSEFPPLSEILSDVYVTYA